MDKNLRAGHRSSYFSGGGCMASPSCLPVVHDEFEYSRIPQNCAAKRNRGWRNLLRKFIRETRPSHGSKPPSFQYDPVSYSQNFDDGSHLDDQPQRLSFVFHDFRDAALDCRLKV
ncbi:uncharacterized protein LOC129312113 [Prosopis cineraria]|uniref:uncharacterized protein LOC129312113 n=1 Tax=Prosopis cineraria TaxID=364024 RepID=UPI0024103473|nr:uncharacterized protein LOC129312113 [Prosopis cineraria]